MNNKIYLFMIFFFASSLTFAQNAVLKGHVIDGKTKEPLVGAYVHFSDKNGGDVTDAFGQYNITKIPFGSYKIKVKFIGYNEFEKVIELSMKLTDLTITLEEKTESLQNVNVYGRAAAESEVSSRHTEKNASNIINVISAQAMQRSPDINAANALQRVSAVTLQRSSGSDEAYAIIRGLEPRYNNTLVNGVKVTSPDPANRFISLSTVPSDLLEKIEVNKTLTPNMEGDAIGGTVNLVFKDAPEYEYFKANASVGYSAIFLNRKYDDFSHGAVQSKSPSEKFGSSYIANPGNFSRANLDFTPKTALPTSLLGFTYGRRFLKNKLGFIVSDSYQNQFYGTNSEFNIAEPDANKNFQEPVISEIAKRTYSTQQMNNGLSAHLDYKFNDKNKITVDNVFLYTFLAQSRLSVDTIILGGNGGRNGAGTGTVFNDNRSFIQNQYAENLKVAGQHVLSTHFIFDWAGVFSNSTQVSPDRADVTYNHLINPDFTRTSDFLYNVTRIWQKSNNKDLSAIANLGYKTGLGTNNSLELKAGGIYRHSTRYNTQNAYTLKPASDPISGGKTPYTDIYAAGWVVYDVTGTITSDKANYTAYENITEGYGEFKLTLDKLDITGGVRVEGTEQGYHTHPVVLDPKSDGKKTYTDLLPSLHLKYRLSDKSNIRASYYKSISRPALFELVPTPTFGQSTDVTGNPLVLHTVADNFDIRYELFPKNEEQFFIGGFYKNITNPIEFALKSMSGGQLSTMPQNFGNATVTGAEVVYSRYFGMFGVSGNYTYTYSHIKSPKAYFSVDASGNPIVDLYKLQDRPLQGQTGNVVNFSLLYKNDKQKAFVQLAYSYTSKTLSYVYPNYGYDYYTQPQSYLSLSAEKQLDKHFIFTGKLNNILNTPTTSKIANLIQSRDVSDLNFSLGFRYSL